MCVGLVNCKLALLVEDCEGEVLRGREQMLAVGEEPADPGRLLVVLKGGKRHDVVGGVL